MRLASQIGKEWPGLAQLGITCQSLPYSDLHVTNELHIAHDE